MGKRIVIDYEVCSPALVVLPEIVKNYLYGGEQYLRVPDSFVDEDVVIQHDFTINNFVVVNSSGQKLIFTEKGLVQYYVTPVSKYPGTAIDLARIVLDSKRFYIRPVSEEDLLFLARAFVENINVFSEFFSGENVSDDDDLVPLLFTGLTKVVNAKISERLSFFYKTNDRKYDDITEYLQDPGSNAMSPYYRDPDNILFESGTFGIRMFYDFEVSSLLGGLVNILKCLSYGYQAKLGVAIIDYATDLINNHY